MINCLRETFPSHCQSYHKTKTVVYSILFTLGLVTTCLLHPVDEGDYNITNQLIVIPVGMSQACFQLVAVDDTIVESEEAFIVVIEAIHSNDIVTGNATIVIVDNDSKKIIALVYYYT